MLNVKHISPKGEETIIEAIRVHAIRPTNVANYPKHPSSVEAIEPDGHKEIWNDGTVYVMSENGSTVSQWMIDNIK